MKDYFSFACKLNLQSTGFSSSKATTLSMDYDTKAIVHADFCDSRMPNHQAATIEYRNINKLVSY